MGKRYDAALRIKPLYQKGAQSLSDSEALEVKAIYPRWEQLIGTVAEVGFKFIYDGKLYRVVQAHTFQSNWVPGAGTESLYARIDESHAGTIDDPIPYEGNMTLEAGKYYEQDGLIYLCTRDSGIEVYAPLADLVGHYVELVEPKDLTEDEELYVEDKISSGLLEEYE